MAFTWITIFDNLAYRRRAPIIDIFVRRRLEAQNLYNFGQELDRSTESDTDTAHTHAP